MLLHAAIGDSSANRRPSSVTGAPTIAPFVPDQIPLPEAALVGGADDATASNTSVAPTTAPFVPNPVAPPTAALARDAEDVGASIGNPDRDPRYYDHAVRQ